MPYSKKVPDFTPEEMKYMQANKDTRTAPEIAKDLNRGVAGIYAYFHAMGWKPFKNDTRPRAVGHPFRKANRRLEATVIQRRIENRPANPK